MFEIDGIVIRTTSFKENDMMVNVVSNNGVKSFLAKGVLKFESKNAPSIQLLNKSHFQLSKSKDGLTLRTGTIINSLFSDETNLSFLVIANLICELTSRIIITDEDAVNIYQFLEKSQTLLASKFNPLTVGLCYFAQVLKQTGYGLNVDCCQKCGKTTQITAVSYVDGGFICQECFDGLNGKKYSSIELKTIRLIFKSDINSFCAHNFDDEICIKLINDLSIFLETQLNIKLKSIKMLNAI